MNPVEICPKNATEFETAARTRNCSGNGRYLCAPDRNLSNLIEFCTDTKRSLFEKGIKKFLRFIIIISMIDDLSVKMNK